MINGISGCSIQIVDTSTIRKLASKDNNFRLPKQIRKQLAFDEKYSMLNIKTPTIKKVGRIDRLCYFDMEYIPSSGYDTYFLKANKKELDLFYTDLSSYLKITSNQIKYKNCKEEYINKLNSIRSDTHQEFINFIKSNLGTNDLALPMGFCHGDLTLSNILFERNQYYFIDFLDSHIETPYYDYAKLKQDLYYGWSQHLGNITNIKISQSIRYIWDKLYKDNQDIYASYEFQYVDALTLLRIIPYAEKDQRITNILNHMIKGLSLYEKFIAAHSR